MNYKKFLNGALILFASILIAISCSSPSGPSNDDETPSDSDDPNTNPSKTELDVNISLSTSATSIVDISTTRAYFKLNTSGQPVSPYHYLSLTFEGNDMYNVDRVEIKSITGLNETEATKAKNGGLKDYITTAVDFSDKNFIYSMIEPSSITGNRFTLTASSTIGAFISSKIQKEGNGGIIEVVLRAHPKDTTKYTKKDLTIYIGLIGTGAKAQ